MLPVLCLMGPTASGKTDLAVELTQRQPLQIISVDSAMVYRGLDIGSAKPDTETLAKAPHWLIDIVDPATPYSAGDFRRDALEAIARCHATGKIPLLVGGTMLYFRILQQGLAGLPSANPDVRAALLQEAVTYGWSHLHQQLSAIDPIAAARIHANDSQRIQRALEVYRLTGKTITQWQQEDTQGLSQYEVRNFALMPEDRGELQARIARRFMLMLQQGFIEEVDALYKRQDLHSDLPAIRSVGYRQVWDYLAGRYTREEMTEKAIIATRQVAKRQMTWLRSWSALQVVKGVTDFFV